MKPDPRLEKLVVTWHRLREQGKILTAQELCKDCPELEQPFRQLMLADPLDSRDLPPTGQETCEASLSTFPEKAPAAADPVSAELGQLGEYQLLEILGEGGMGIVYLAEDIKLKRKVALKRMKPEAAKNPNARARFLREAQASATLDHEHIAPIHHVGESDNVPFLVMPLLRGEMLETRLRREFPLPLPEAARIGREIALGLQAAHDNGVIHRDIKPSNIWLEIKDEGGRMKDEKPSGSSFRAKILDFGLARLTEDNIQITRSGDIAGTPAYMSPEQAKGEATNHRCDLFSLGAVLYLMTTGRLPFAGPNVTSVLLAVANDTPADPRTLNPHLPPALATLITRLLSKDPSKRPNSAREVAQSLAAIEDKLARPAAPPRRPTPGWAIAAGLLFALAGGIIAFQVIIRLRTPDGKEAEIEVPDKSRVEIGPDGNVKVTLPGDKKVAEEKKVERVKEEKKVVVEPPPEQKVETKVVDLKPEPIKPFAAGDPISPLALVARPAPLKGVESWTIETKLHHGMVCTGEVNPQGTLVATGGDDGTVRIWDAKNWNLVGVIPSQGTIQLVQWAPHDGKSVAVLTGRHGWEFPVLQIWNPETGQKLKTIEKDISAFSWSPDGTKLALSVRTVGGGTYFNLVIFDLVKNMTIRTFTDIARGAELAWSADSQRVAYRFNKGAPKVFALTEPASQQPVRFQDNPFKSNNEVYDSSGKFRLRITNLYPVSMLSLRESRDPKSLLLQTPNGGAYVVASGSGKLLIDGRQWGQAYGLSATGKVLSVAPFNKNLRLVDSASGEEIKSWPNGYGALWVNAEEAVVGFSPKKGRVFVWKLKNDALMENDLAGWSAGGHQHLSQNGEWLSSDFRLNSTSSATVWETATGKQIQKWTKRWAPAFSPDSRFLLLCKTGTVGSSVLDLWDLQAGKIVKTIEVKGSMTSCAAFSPDGKQVAINLTAEAAPPRPESRVGIWDLEEGTMRVLPGFATIWPYHQIAWGGDSRCLHLLNRLNDKWVVVDTQTGGICSQVRTFSNHGDSNVKWMIVNAEGHYRVENGDAPEMVYVVRTEKGTETLTPEEFATRE